MGLSGPGLTIGQDSRIETLEAPEDQVAGTDIEYVLLGRAVIKNSIKAELFGSNLQLLCVLYTLNAQPPVALTQLSTHQRPYSHCDFDGAVL